MIRNSGIQFSSFGEIKKFQEERLAEELAYVLQRSPFYKRMFAEKGINAGTIRKIEDLRSLPVTTKQNLQLYNADFICVPKSDIVDYVTTSGTLGDPVTFALTSGDMDRLAYNEALSFTMAGCAKSDILQLMTTIDRRFMAGLAYFMGARELGCGVIRVGNGIPELQWDTINRIHPTVCVVVPSFLLKLINYAQVSKIDHNESSLKKAICIGEQLRDPNFQLTTLGSQIQEGWKSLEMFSTYASTEMQTSFTECRHHRGCHLPPDLIIVEFLDDNNQPVTDGEAGEVTITTLGVRGMPLLRFKTGDVCFHHTEPCACGRNTIRLGPVLGRKGQMIKFKGTTLYPPALYDILDSIPEIKIYIVEVFTNDIGTDEVQIKIASDNCSDEFVKQIKDVFRSRVRVAPNIVFEPAEYIAKLQMPPMSRKPVKFIDLRNNY